MRTSANFIKNSRGYLTTSPRGFFFSSPREAVVTCIKMYSRVINFQVSPLFKNAHDATYASSADLIIQAQTSSKSKAGERINTSTRP